MSQEQEVLELVAQGQSNRAIADRLVLSASAVEKHISNRFDKLDLFPDDTDQHRRVRAAVLSLDHVASGSACTRPLTPQLAEPRRPRSTSGGIPMSQLHVVFGAGPIGLATVDALVARDLPVRVVSRSGRAVVPSGVEVVAADASSPTAATAAADGAAVVHQCLNPEYHRWAEDFPPLQAAVVAGCRAHGARLVSFENVYMYGDTGGAPITEDTPTRPHTRKGRVRLAMAEELRSLHEAGELDVVTARASDYFGPGALEQSPLGELVIGKALAGKSAQVVGDPSRPHSYTFIPDAGRTMAELGTRDDVSGEVFHVPNAPARSTREIVDMIAEQLGTEVEVQVAPKLLLRVMGLFNPSIREVIEMLYEFEQPFVVDSSKAEQRLGLSPTPLDEALATTIAWFRARS